MKRILLLLTFLCSVLSWGQVTIFSETMGNSGGTVTIAAYEAANGFDNDAYTMTNGAATNPADIRTSSASTGSALSNVFFTTTSGQYGFAIEGVDASTYTALTLDYLYRKESASAHATFAVEFWNGSSWVSLAATSATLFNEAAGAGANWYAAKQLSLPAAAQINGLKIRFLKSGTNSIRIDDIVLKGTSISPSLSASALTTFGSQCVGGTYGPNSFTITGSSLNGSDVTVGGLTGYTYCTTAGGTYVSPLVLSPVGATLSQQIFVKFSPVAAISYNGNIPISGGGATAINVVASGSGLAAVTPAVSIAASPSGAICAGSSVTFTATPSNLGGGTAAYQWKLNGGNVGTGTTYTSTTLANTDTVTCDLTVTGGCVTSSTATSNSIVMTVNAIPVTPVAPTAAANPSCGATTLNIMVPPGGETYYWQGTTSNGTNTGSPTSSTFPITTSGTYYVRSRSAAGCWSMQSSIVMTVNTAVSIGTVPDRIITEGTATTFTVTPTSGTGLTYQWQVDTGSGFNNLANVAPYSTVTTNTLNISTASTVAMNGYLYRCIVTGTVPCSSVTSNSGLLTVNAAAEINVMSSGTIINDNDLSSALGDNTDFGSVDIAASTIVKTFTVENLGSGVLNLTGTPLVAISGADAADFTLTAIPSTPIAASGSTTFQITFNPSALGIRDAVLTIANNDSNENPYNFSIQGRGTTREINVRGNSTDILNLDNTPSTSDDTDFGSVIYTGTITKTFTIQNTAFAPNGGVLSLTGVSPYVIISGTDAADFTVTAIPSTPIAVSGNTTFQITFDPTTPGIKNATLSIANDDSNENPYVFDIRATATDIPNIVLSSANPSVAASNIVQAENNHVIYAFYLVVTTFNATLNNVVFTTTGTYAASSITNFKLWYSTDATFSSGTDTMVKNLTATLGTGLHSFTSLTQNIAVNTTGYFFITTDIPCAATVGNNIIVNAITTADLTFSSGNKSGSAFASDAHTFVGATPINVTGAATSNCQNSSVTVSWTAPAGCKDNVMVFVSSTPFTTAVPTGNGGSYTENTIFGSGTSFDGGFAAYKGTGTSVTITGLTNGTTYYYKIFTRNGLLWSNGVTVNCTPVLTYCALTATNTGFEHISNVTVGTDINNSTASSGYANYTSQIANAAIGSATPISVTLTPSYATDNVYVYVDWNKDGDWSDAGENITMSYTAVTTSFTATGTITPPVTALLGNTRMRVIVVDGTVSNACNGGANFTYGEVEDYTINVLPACVPTHTVTSFTPTSGPVGTEVTINGTGLTGTTVSFSGVNATILSNTGTQIVAVIPVGATTGNMSVKDSQPCAVDNAFTVITKDNTSCEGASSATDLIIYDIHDEKTGSGGFITLYNGTAATVNLTNYRIYRTGDHDDGNEADYANLTGTIAPGALGILKVSVGSCGPASTNGTIDSGFNENDGIQLRNAAGTVVVDDVDAYPTAAGFYMVRNAGALNARTSYVAADWSTIPLNAGECYPSAGLTPPSGGIPPVVTTHPTYSPSCGSTSAILNTAGTQGFAGGNPLAYQWYFAAPGSATWTVVTDGGIYSGATTTSLNVSDVTGVLNYQYYCQIRENTATCYAASNAIKITDTSASTWNGSTWVGGTPTLTKAAIIDGTYVTATNGNFSCCSLTVNSGVGRSLTISSGGYVEVQNNITNNGTLDVLNNGSLVQIDDAGVNTGNIFVKRTANVRLQDYSYWSSPISSATGTPVFPITSVSSNTPLGVIWKWGPTSLNQNGGEGMWLNTTENMVKGTGYAVRGPSGTSNTTTTPLNTNFVGVPNNGVIPVTISRGNDLNAGTAGPNGIMRTIKDDNFNLIGNPYPSAIDADLFIARYGVVSSPDYADIEGSVRIWSHSTLPLSSNPNPFYANYQMNYSANDYITYNSLGSQVGPATYLGKIPSGQGFFVLMKDGAAGTNTINLKNALRSRTFDNSQFFKTTSSNVNAQTNTVEKHRIWLDIISPTNAVTRTLFGYATGATDELDNTFDATTDYTLSYNLYSIVNNEMLTIQGRTLPFNVEDKVQMGVKVDSPGLHKIAIASADGIFSNSNNNGQKIYLEDKSLNIIHDLTVGPYEFNGVQGTYDSRFVIRYTNGTVLTNETFDANNDVVVFTQNEELNINASQEIAKVEVFDVLGRNIYNNSKVNDKVLNISSIANRNQTLLVRITFTTGQTVTKKVIK